MATPEQLERADIVLRRTGDQVKDILARVQATQIEVTALRSEVRMLLLVFRRILADPNTVADAAAALKDFQVSGKATTGKHT